MKAKISFILITVFTFQLHAEKLLIDAGKPTNVNTTQSSDKQLVLAVGKFDPMTEKLDFSKTSILDTESSKYRIVQFSEGKADSQWLKKQGIKVVSYIPNNAYVIVADSRTNFILDKQPNIRWHGPYSSAYKISPELWIKNLDNQHSYEVMVAFFSDISKNSMSLLLRKNIPDVRVKQILPNTNGVILSIKSNNYSEVIATLSKIEEIQFIQKVIPAHLNNTEAVSATQANQESGGASTNDNYTPTPTPIWDKGLFGTGQIVAVADSGLDANEDWFVNYDNGTTVTNVVTEAETVNPPQIGTLHPNNKIIGYFVFPLAEAYDHGNFHGTHVAGSVAGDRLEAIGAGPSGSVSSPNDSGYDNDDGMAPNAQLLIQDLGSEENGTSVYVLGSPLYRQAYNSGARIHTNSYGGGAGEYTFNSKDTDDFLYNFEDMLILFSAGNDGPSLDTIGSPGTSKNVLTVGALLHGNSPIAVSFSSRGPTDDGRLKPDIMATGTSIESAAGDSSTNSTIESPSRKSISGTSMSTPITAGSSALVRQYYTEGFYPTGIANANDEHTPTGVLLKATLINGAGIASGHFDNTTGWGRVNLNNSIMFDDSDKHLRAWEINNANGLKTGENTEIKLEVKAGQPLAITLAWYDVPGPFGSNKTLVNDIDLEVRVDGQLYKGNVWSDTAISSTGGERDSINTVEQVRIPNPIEGVYTISVKGTNVPGVEQVNSFRQGFALVATGHFDNIGSVPSALTAVSNLNAESLGDNGIQLSWNGGANADYFEVYKVQGTCSTADFKNARFVGMTENNNYTDFRTLNGIQYAYKIRAGQYQGLGDLSSTCVDITSQQACDLLPFFSQSSIIISDNTGDLCHTKLEWDAASASCPGNTSIKYNIYRSLDSDFIPGASNLLTSTTSTSFDDINAPSDAAYYVIRAEDSGGNSTTGTERVRSQAVGTGFVNSPLLEDVDTVAIMNLNSPWQVVSNNGADSSLLSYKTGQATDVYPPDTCSAIVSNVITLSADDATPSISYQAQYDIENNWDGVVVQISNDDGKTWSDFPPNGGYPGNFSETVLNNGSYVNACNFPPTQGAFSGTNNGSYQTYTHNLTSFVGEDVKIRWLLSTDSAAEEEGFYIDNIQYPNIQIPNSCTVNTGASKPQPGFYYDRTRNGHGFVVEAIEGTDLYFTIFYTYNSEGKPEWYTSLTTLEGNVLNMEMVNNTLQRSIYDYDIGPGGATPFTIDDSIGTNSLKIDFNSNIASAADACNDGVDRPDNVSLASWQIGNQTGDWCLEPIIAENNYPTPDFGGTWWAGLADTGWGLSITYSGDVLVVIMYYFDADGNPRWAQGIESGFQVGQEIVLDLLELSGYARDANSTEVTDVVAGSLTLTLDAINGNDDDGVMAVNITYQGSEGGTWSRDKMPVKIFTAPH